MPPVTDRASFEAELGRLRVREKAHTREGDAIAAARRRLPTVEVDAGLELIGPSGPVTLLETFEGRRLLSAYYFMWHPGGPAAEQCEGCTFYTSQVIELAYLHSRDIPPGVLPARRRPRLRDLLDQAARRRGDGQQLRADGPHRVRAPGAVGGLAAATPTT